MTGFGQNERTSLLRKTTVWLGAIIVVALIIVATTLALGWAHGWKY